MHDRDHTGFDFDDLFLTAGGAVLVALVGVVIVGLFLWIAASPDRPSPCSQYRGAEVAACVMEK